MGYIPEEKRVDMAETHLRAPTGHTHKCDTMLRATSTML